ncbi:DUF2202 domain-containing protein [Roseofilum sp. BLCC_M154]|uniref:DUF2202 domain-containing protein n=1 Tax=Roseofilum acuticapitatum BLCC-M154 TaxID=3022444 RepID=A0ABT7AXP6_9CYAN|nr:DUF2202 domain-containing protein [Roseofilum acuticapitatum]MDJ1171687.1 DUF2202 domain-containing protein [Roseofilum acuticapitatum BLCC-M154]
MWSLILTLTTNLPNLSPLSTIHPPQTLSEVKPMMHSTPHLVLNPLSDSETEGLLYMREEEKLAHDIYVALYRRWQMRIFDNIAQSETRHMSAVLSVLNRYGINDPIAGKNLGVFTNPDLQQLYNSLVRTGQVSLVEALKVGAEIEELDIADLQERSSQTQNPDLQRLYQNLEQGSHNHLRSFVSTLKRQTGETYQPQHLSTEQYNAIISSAHERGRQGRNQGRKGYRGGER